MHQFCTESHTTGLSFVLDVVTSFCHVMWSDLFSGKFPCADFHNQASSRDPIHRAELHWRAEIMSNCIPPFNTGVVFLNVSVTKLLALHPHQNPGSADPHLHCIAWHSHYLQIKCLLSWENFWLWNLQISWLTNEFSSIKYFSYLFICTILKWSIN